MMVFAMNRLIKANPIMAAFILAGTRNESEKRGPVVEEGNSQSSAVEEWPEWMNRRGARKEDCQYQDQVAGRGKKGAGVEVREITVMLEVFGDVF